MFFLSVCVAEDPANRTREEKKRFRSRQTASKQGTNHSDSYSRRIDLPRSNAVAREARTFAYVPFTATKCDWSLDLSKKIRISRFSGGACPRNPAANPAAGSPFGRENGFRPLQRYASSLVRHASSALEKPSKSRSKRC